MNNDALITATKTAAAHVTSGRDSEGKVTGRHGYKVFISALWSQLQAEYPEYTDGCDLAYFKGWLLEQHKADRLELGRADLMGAFNYAEVQASAIKGPGRIEFNFLILV